MRESKTIDLVGIAEAMAVKEFNDGGNWTALKADGSVVRCMSQDGAETVALQGKTHAVVSYHANYVQVKEGNDVIGLAWPQT